MSALGPGFENKVRSLKESCVIMEIRLARLGDDGRISAAMEEMEVFKKSLEQIREKKERLQGIIHKESLEGKYNEKAQKMYDTLEKISMDKLAYLLDLKQKELMSRFTEMRERKKRLKKEAYGEVDEKTYLEELEKVNSLGIWYDEVHRVGGCAARFKDFEEYLKYNEERGGAACVIVGRGLLKSGLVDTSFLEKLGENGDLEVLELSKNYEPWHIDSHLAAVPDMFADFSNEIQMQAIPDNSIEEIYLETFEEKEEGIPLVRNPQMYRNAFRILKQGGALVVDNSTDVSYISDNEQFMFKRERAVAIRKGMRKAGFLVLRSPVIDSARNNTESEKIIAVKQL